MQNTGWLTETFKKEEQILSIIGILSAIVDNEPFVAATMGMDSIEIYPVDNSFWILLAYCIGTGGSLLVKGSAARVAEMGLKKIPFGWYLENISWMELLGYIAGIGAFLLQQWILN